MQNLTAVIVGGLWYTPPMYYELRRSFAERNIRTLTPAITTLGWEDKVWEVISSLPDDGDCIIIAHSFGAIVAHEMLRFAPEAVKRVRAFVGLGAVSPLGFEWATRKRVTREHPVHTLRQLFGGEFRIPTPELFAEYFRAPKDLFRYLAPEPSRLLRELFLWDVVANVGRAELVAATFTCPVLFCNGQDDLLITARSLREWREYYGHSCDDFLMFARHAHHSIAVSPSVHKEVGEWLERVL